MLNCCKYVHARFVGKVCNTVKFERVWWITGMLIYETWLVIVASARMWQKEAFTGPNRSARLWSICSTEARSSGLDPRQWPWEDQLKLGHAHVPGRFFPHYPSFPAYLQEISNQFHLPTLNLFLNCKSLSFHSGYGPFLFIQSHFFILSFRIKLSCNF